MGSAFLAIHRACTFSLDIAISTIIVATIVVPSVIILFAGVVVQFGVAREQIATAEEDATLVAGVLDRP